MVTNRRNTLKKLALASTALVALPQWAHGWRAEDLNISGSSFSEDQQALLAAVADTIIPKGDAIGALDIGVDKFLIRLFDDCYEEDVRDNIKKQLAALDAGSESTYGASFLAQGQKDCEDLLMQFAGSEDEARKSFFRLIKGETIRGFSTSREVMIDYHHYQVAPGHFYGSVDL